MEEKIKQEYLETLSAINDNTNKIIEDFNKFLQIITKENEKPPRDLWPDRLLNPSINGAGVLLADFGYCAAQVLPGELDDETRKALFGFGKKGKELIDLIDEHTGISTLNESLSHEAKLVDYLTQRKRAVTDAAKHASNVDALINKMVGGFMTNSNALCELYKRAVSNDGMLEKIIRQGSDMRSIMTDIRQIKSDIGTMFSSGDYARQPRRNHEQEKLWSKLGVFMADHADRKKYPLKWCCRRVFEPCNGKWTNLDAFYAYARNHLTELPG